MAATALAHTRLASVPMMNRSRASADASSEKRPMPLRATTTARPSGKPTRIVSVVATRSRYPIVVPPRSTSRTAAASSSRAERRRIPPCSPSRTVPLVARRSTSRVSGFPPTTATDAPRRARGSAIGSGTSVGTTTTVMSIAATMAAAIMTNTADERRVVTITAMSAIAMPSRRPADTVAVASDSGSIMASVCHAGSSSALLSARSNTWTSAGTAASSRRSAAAFARRLTAPALMPSRSAASRWVSPSASRS